MSHTVLVNKRNKGRRKYVKCDQNTHIFAYYCLHWIRTLLCFTYDVQSKSATLAAIIQTSFRGTVVHHRHSYEHSTIMGTTPVHSTKHKNTTWGLRPGNTASEKNKSNRETADKRFRRPDRNSKQSQETSGSQCYAKTLRTKLRTSTATTRVLLH